MHIIVCVDDRLGMLFNKRRQSKDASLRKRILSGLDGRRFLMNHYSFRQFASDEGADAVTVTEDFLDVALEDDVCFVENSDLSAYAKKIKSVTLYKWNRTYPCGERFPAELLCGKTLVSSSDFAGVSHEKITEEIYK